LTYSAREICTFLRAEWCSSNLYISSTQDMAAGRDHTLKGNEIAKMQGALKLEDTCRSEFRKMCSVIIVLNTKLVVLRTRGHTERRAF
jgi:hypothetical protein